MSALEETLGYQMGLVGLQAHREYRFGAEAVGGGGKGLRARLNEQNLKDWRFDFAFPELRIAVEVEGGTFMLKSRHTSGTGYEGDCEKYNNALLLGWQVLRFTGKTIKSGEALAMVEKLVRKQL